jgi:hypothetical protein
MLATLCIGGLHAASANAQNLAPVISGSPALDVASGQAYNFQPAASDPNGDSLSFGVSGLPRWANFDKRSGRLSGRPGSRDVGVTRTITIAVSDGRLSAALPSFRITVRAGGAPTIVGVPPTTATENQPYSFSASASDPEGDRLSFSIAGKPSWATFSRWTGQLSGTPGTGTAGTYAGIQIFVTDGHSTVSLPAFSITVAPATSSVNRAPVIAGTPATTVVAGRQYAFTPTATDPDSTTLTFTVSNRPTWAMFDGASGRLAGTPATGDVGTYPNIVISASDGQSTASLQPFSIVVEPVAVSSSVQVRWQAPDQNVDGTPLTNLAGYRVRYGQSSDNLAQVLEIPSAVITSVTVEGLAAGYWYFGIEAYNSAGVGSTLSNIAQKLVY